jgi:cytochrome c oxidase subunit 2
MVVTMTPSESGEFGIVCNEYCGVGHHQMVGKIYVVDKKK